MAKPKTDPTPAVPAPETPAPVPSPVVEKVVEVVDVVADTVEKVDPSPVVVAVAELVKKVIEPLANWVDHVIESVPDVSGKTHQIPVHSPVATAPAAPEQPK